MDFLKLFPHIHGYLLFSYYYNYKDLGLINFMNSFDFSEVMGWTVYKKI